METNNNSSINTGQNGDRQAETTFRLKGAYGNLPFLRNPGLGIATLFGSFVVMMVLVSIGLVIVMYLSGGAEGTVSAKAMRIATVIQDICVFIAPAIIAAVVVTRLPADLLTINVKPNLKVMTLAMIVLLTSMPVMDFIISINQSIPLPEGIEKILQSLEDNANSAIQQLAGESTVGNLIMGILIIGILTGISEELFFRGAMQNLFMSTKMRKHLCVWLTAVIFSFMHFQFYGFVPRILLGAYFGYLIWWSGSVWVPIVCHAFNNSLVVVAQWMADRSGEAMEEGREISTYMATDYFTIALSAVVTTLGIIILYRNTHKTDQRAFPAQDKTM